MRVSKSLCLAGANPVGALGHVAALLEVAEEIQRGKIPQIRRIYLAMGSSCTMCGLVVGIAVARAKNMAFLGSLEQYSIEAVVSHHMAAKLPYCIMRLLFGKLIRDTAEIIWRLGGVDVRKECMEVFECIHFRRNYAVKYGMATPQSREAKQRLSHLPQRMSSPAPSSPPSSSTSFIHHHAVANESSVSSFKRVNKKGNDNDNDSDSNNNSNNNSDSNSVPWLCSTFTGKSAAALLDDLERDRTLRSQPVLFWCSKSAIQPQGIAVSAY